MVAATETFAEQKTRPWAGYVISALTILFLTADAVGKLIKPQAVITGTVELGYQESIIVPLGILLLACTILYAIPRTAVLGAILLTGYLGGTVATHARIGNPVFSHMLFGVYIGIFVWLGLYLRDARLRQLVPFTSRP